MLQQRVRQPPNRTEIDRRTRRQVLREDTDAAFADFAAEAEGAARAYGGACVDAAADGDGLGLGDADDVVAAAVGGGVEVGVGPDSVAEGLDNGFRGFVVPRGARAEAGAAAVDPKGRGGGVEEEREGGEADDGVGVVHLEGVRMVVEGVWFGVVRAGLEI